ncbi:ABC transporter permease [Cryomorpha ignava]|uniref:Cell division protein FtsX n=1 Tax=Cryomorpha ignava TaxID=101383 RepID=A0A7K3WSY9_9FLAO|nr:ABC transporter permease [Cryomorpha ignava]NEN24576.1 ABC transporter permease [Cryomorpha ignava]
MAASPDKYARKRARSSAISTVIGISLVLFMLGILSVLVLNARKLSDTVKENIQIQVFLDEDVKEADVIRLKKEIDAETFTRSTTYVSKEEAAKQLTEDLGEDFISFLGYNPLQAAIDLRLNADYAHPDSIENIVEGIENREAVAEVVYSPNLIKQINQNVNKIGLVLLGFSALLLLIAIALINNTIRLTIYSKRFIIRSMQLVGATRGFIQRPFIFAGIMQGLYASFIAILLILGVLYAVRMEIPEFFEFTDILMFVKLFGLVALLGIIISGLSTLFAVRRYLRMDARKIY